MIQSKDKIKDQSILEKAVTRRNVLKVVAATATAAILDVFPEIGGVNKAFAQIFTNCRSGSTYYCCDITTHLISCMDNGDPCSDLFRVDYRVDCGPVFGCSSSCVGICRGPFIDCAFICVAPAPACWMCPKN